MAKGGHNRKPDALKKAQGTFRASRAKPAPTIPALESWPAAPERFNPGEVEAWGRLGEVLMLAGTVAEQDLLMVSYAAQMLARVDAAFADPGVKPANLNALLRVTADVLKNLGLTPMARNTVTPLPRDTANEDDELEEFT